MNTRKSRAKNIITTLFSGTLGIVLILLLVYLSDISFNTIVQSILTTKYYYVICIVVITGVIIALTSWKWEAILHDITELKTPMPHGYFFYLSALGIVSNVIIPHVGNFGLKTASLKLEHNVPVVSSSVSILIEQLFDLFMLILFTIPALCFFLGICSLEMAIAFLLIFVLLSGVILTMSSEKAIELMARGYTLLFKGASKLPVLKNRIRGDIALLHTITLISRKTACKVFVYSLLRQLCVIGRVYIVMVSLRMQIPFAGVMLAAPLVQTVILIGITPGALGTLEAGWFGVLTLLGVERSAIGVFVIVIRILTDCALVLLAVMSYCWVTFNRRLYKTVHSKLVEK